MALQLLRETDHFTVSDMELMGANGEPDVVYTLRPITAAVTQALVAPYRTVVTNPRTRASEFLVDNGAYSQALVMYSIVAWEGVTIDGAPAPCDDEHKCLLDQGVCLAILQAATSLRRSVVWHKVEDTNRKPDSGGDLCAS